MSPRRSAIDAQATRSRIIEAAVTMASKEGLEGVTIGRLALELEMSKAGILGHFGTKESLQLATFDAAVESMRRQVPDKVGALPAGRGRLLRLCDAWISYLEAQQDAAGGCLLIAAAAEFEGRPGAVRTAVLSASSSWHALLTGEIQAAIETGELPADTDVTQLVFELNGVALSANQAIQLHRDRAAGERARRAIHKIIPGSDEIGARPTRTPTPRRRAQVHGR
jgi:AcrR family transcriptional regulator